MYSIAKDRPRWEAWASGVDVLLPKLRFGLESDSVQSLLQKTTYPLAYKDVSPIYGCVIACLTALLAIRFQEEFAMDDEFENEIRVVFIIG